MSIKIKVSYTDDAEADAVLLLFRPLMNRYKVKKCNGSPPYKHLYITPMKRHKPKQGKDFA